MASSDGKTKAGAEAAPADPPASDAQAEAGPAPVEAGPAVADYIVTATKINRVVGGVGELLTYGQRVSLDPEHPDTVRWLAARALTPAEGNHAPDASASVLLPGNTGATPEAPNGTGDGQPSSVQNSDPNQPQGTPAGPAGALGSKVPDDGRGVPVS